MTAKLLVSIAAAAAVLAFAGGIAYATIPDAAGLIHGCYKTASGQLRVVDSGSCGAGENPLPWSQKSGTLAWARVAANGSVLSSGGNLSVARAGPGFYCVAVTGDTAHVAMAVLDAQANVGGTIQTGVYFPFFPSDCPSSAYYIQVVTRPQSQDGGLPGEDRAFYLVVS